MAESSDEDLMLALQGGELVAFDTLFRRHYEPVRALCERLIAISGVGDDLAQETFLRVLRHRSTYRGDARFTTWLYRIARNVTLEQVARHARDRRIAERWRMETPTSIEPEARENTDHLAMAMQALTPEQREVLVLCRYHDLPFSEIGAILDCTPGAARVRAHRALVALRQAYESLGMRGVPRSGSDP